MMLRGRLRRAASCRQLQQCCLCRLLGLLGLLGQQGQRQQQRLLQRRLKLLALLRQKLWQRLSHAQLRLQPSQQQAQAKASPLLGALQ